MTAVTMHHFSGLSAPFVRSKGTVSGGVFNDKVSDFHSNFLHNIVGGSWPVRRPGDKVTSPCVALSYRRKSLENFTGEIQTKKFTAVPLAAWDGGFLSFFKIASQ